MSRIVEQLIEAIGREQTILLISNFAGKTIYIPRTTSRRNDLIEQYSAVVNVIGDEAAMKLREYYNKASRPLYIPILRSEQTKASHEKIARGYQGGSIREYAAELGLSVDAVYKILRKHGVTLPGQPLKDRALIDYAGESIKGYAKKRGISPDLAKDILKRNGSPHLVAIERRKEENRQRQLDLAQKWEGEWPLQFARRHNISKDTAEAIIKKAMELPDKKHVKRWGKDWLKPFGKQ